MMCQMKVLIALIFCVFSYTSQAQQYVDNSKTKEVKSLIGKEKEINGFGNVDFRLGEVVDQQALIMGVYGGMLINKYFMFGVAAYGIATDSQFEGFNPETGEARDLNLYGGYAGMLMGFKVASREIIHLSVPMIIGAGKLDVSDDHYFELPWDDNAYTLESSPFFVFEPSALLEINVSHHFRLGFGAGYRLVRGSGLENVSDEDLSGYTGVVSIQLGKF